MVDHFKEWVMDNNPEFDKVIEDQIYLPQEKKVISKRLRKLAKQLEGKGENIMARKSTLQRIRNS